VDFPFDNKDQDKHQDQHGNGNEIKYPLAPYPLAPSADTVEILKKLKELTDKTILMEVGLNTKVLAAAKQGTHKVELSRKHRGTVAQLCHTYFG